MISTRHRFQQHKYNFNEWLNGNASKISIFPFFKKYGINDFKMILIKTYQVCDKNHLSSYEQLWVSRLKCCNRNMPWGVSIHSCKWMTQVYQVAYQEVYREVNKEKLTSNSKATHICGCGKSYTHGHKKRHELSTYHINHA